MTKMQRLLNLKNLKGGSLEALVASIQESAEYYKEKYHRNSKAIYADLMIDVDGDEAERLYAELVYDTCLEIIFD